MTKPDPAVLRWRRLAVTFVLLAVSAAIATFAVVLAWNLAQAEGWSGALRSFAVGDPFPLALLIAGVLAAVASTAGAVACFRRTGRARRGEPSLVGNTPPR